LSVKGVGVEVELRSTIFTISTMAVMGVWDEL
jgi:hypothetical protein